MAAAVKLKRSVPRRTEFIAALAEQTETINTLLEWVRAGELSAVDAMRMFREQYKCSLREVIECGLEAAARKAEAEAQRGQGAGG